VTGAGIAPLLFVLVVGIGGALLLYYLVEAEYGSRLTMDWQSAENAARKDQNDQNQRRR
jgi:hypothetical protein